MTDDANVLHSHPTEEKEPTQKAILEDPKQHGSEVHGTGSEAGGDPGEGRTGTGKGSTDS